MAVSTAIHTCSILEWPVWAPILTLFLGIMLCPILTLFLVMLDPILTLFLGIMLCPILTLFLVMLCPILTLFLVMLDPILTLFLGLMLAPILTLFLGLMLPQYWLCFLRCGPQYWLLFLGCNAGPNIDSCWNNVVPDSVSFPANYKLVQDSKPSDEDPFSWSQ